MVYFQMLFRSTKDDILWRVYITHLLHGRLIKQYLFFKEFIWNVISDIWYIILYRNTNNIKLKKKHTSKTTTFFVIFDRASEAIPLQLHRITNDRTSKTFIVFSNWKSNSKFGKTPRNISMDSSNYMNQRPFPWGKLIQHCSVHALAACLFV